MVNEEMMKQIRRPGAYEFGMKSTDFDDHGDFDDDSEEKVKPPPMLIPGTRRNSSQRPSLISSKSNYSTDDVVSYEGRNYEGSQTCPYEGCIDILTAYKSGYRNEHVRCVVHRDRSKVLYNTYRLRIEDTCEPMIFAKKTGLTNRCNFLFFDMTKGHNGKSPTKASENYIGELKAVNGRKTEFILVNRYQEGDEEVAAFCYGRHEHTSKFPTQIKPPIKSMDPEIPELQKPLSQSSRNMRVLLPPLNEDGHSVPNFVEDENNMKSYAKSFIPSTRDNKSELDGDTFLTKEPTIVDGTYRLNFHGRVLMPSIKNFQLIPDDEMNNIIVQFGKVEDDTFHLDFKAPFNALQAFAIALSQFVQ